MSVFHQIFTDFPLSDLPEMTAGFSDCSYRNDACPSFWHDGANLQIMINYSDDTKREMPGGKRFYVSDQDGETVLETDDWSAVLAAVSARL